MQRDMERVIAEALSLASQRGGVVASVTLATRDPSEAVLRRVKTLLRKGGVDDAEIVLEPCDAPTKILALEIRRSGA